MTRRKHVTAQTGGDVCEGDVLRGGSGAPAPRSLAQPTRSCSMCAHADTRPPRSSTGNDAGSGRAPAAAMRFALLAASSEGARAIATPVGAARRARAARAACAHTAAPAPRPPAAMSAAAPHSAPQRPRQAVAVRVKRGARRASASIRLPRCCSSRTPRQWRLRCCLSAAASSLRPAATS
jgi:hypothetical protein